MTNDDALYGFRLRLFALAREWGNVRAACRAMGVHPSSYYRWRRQLVRFGPEILRPRERRAPKMPNQTSPMVEQRVLAFSLAHPGFGPARISAELRRPKWGGIRLSTNGVHRALPATACRPGPRGSRSSPATRHRPHPRGPSSQNRDTCRSITLGRWSRSTASSWGACQGPKARSGNTPRSTWGARFAGQSCTRPRRILRRDGPPTWLSGWPPIWRHEAGIWRRS